MRGGLRGASDWILELGYLDEALETVGGVLRRGGGLHRRRLLLVTIWGGAGEFFLGPVGFTERLTEDAERRRRGEYIA